MKKSKDKYAEFTDTEVLNLRAKVNDSIKKIQTVTADAETTLEKIKNEKKDIETEIKLEMNQNIKNKVQDFLKAEHEQYLNTLKKNNAIVSEQINEVSKLKATLEGNISGFEKIDSVNIVQVVL